MLNDRDDKFDGQDESEYHFSEEDVNYEVEADSPKPASASSGFKENLFARLDRSKRMLISIVVFIVLVFVAYKMVAPTSTAPATDIAAAPMQVPQTVATNKAPPQTMTTQPTAPAMVSNAANPASAIPQTPPTTPANQPALAPPLQAVQTGPVPASPALQQPPPAVHQATEPPQNVQIVTGMPSVIPVQSAVRQYNAQNQPVNTQGQEAIANEKAISQAQSDYAQKLNDYASQNKALQDQMQALSTRVMNMEMQLNQLVQALTRANEGSNPPSSSMEAPPPPPPVAATTTRMAYTVQAIIPGRAWLRSDTGETITVTEGDVIKDLGRVTKIDPYDGVVEINTGSKVVSLSYGNGN